VVRSWHLDPTFELCMPSRGRDTSLAEHDPYKGTIVPTERDVNIKTVMIDLLTGSDCPGDIKPLNSSKKKDVTPWTNTPPETITPAASNQEVNQGDVNAVQAIVSAATGGADGDDGEDGNDDQDSGRRQGKDSRGGRHRNHRRNGGDGGSDVNDVSRPRDGMQSSKVGSICQDLTKAEYLSTRRTLPSIFFEPLHCQIPFCSALGTLDSRLRMRILPGPRICPPQAEPHLSLLQLASHVRAPYLVPK
jgi:hypothetical protein